MARAATITAETVRAMLGLADRGRVLDLFEKLMGGKIAEALADLNELYDRGADPLAVMQDLLEIDAFPHPREGRARTPKASSTAQLRKAAAPPRWRASSRRRR